MGNENEDEDIFGRKKLSPGSEFLGILEWLRKCIEKNQFRR